MEVKYKVVEIIKWNCLIGYGIIDIDAPYVYEHEYTETEKGRAESKCRLMNTFYRLEKSK